MIRYEILALNGTVGEAIAVTLGRKTYMKYDAAGKQENILTRVLNDGWKVEHFSVTEITSPNDHWTRYHFVVSRDDGDADNGS